MIKGKMRNNTLIQLRITDRARCFCVPLHVIFDRSKEHEIYLDENQLTPFLFFLLPPPVPSNSFSLPLLLPAANPSVKIETLSPKPSSYLFGRTVNVQVPKGCYQIPPPSHQCVQARKTCHRVPSSLIFHAINFQST